MSGIYSCFLVVIIVCYVVVCGWWSWLFCGLVFVIGIICIVVRFLLVFGWCGIFDVLLFGVVWGIGCGFFVGVGFVVGFVGVVICVVLVKVWVDEC